jgi:hypothetical protein
MELVGRRRNGIKRRVGRTVRERREKVMKRSKEVKEIMGRGGRSRKGKVGMMVDKRKGGVGKRGEEVKEIMGRREGKGRVG